MNLIVALCSIGGAIFGGIITVFMNLYKDKIMFDKNRKKEEQTRKFELLKREEDLIRKLVSRLFGFRYSIPHFAKVRNECAVTSGYYSRLADLENNRDAKLVLIELMREQNNKAEAGMTNFIASIQELTEIIGEYLYLMPESNVGQAYTKFTNMEFHINLDFKDFNSQVELADYRMKTMNEYIPILELMANNIFNIVQIIDTESRDNFKASLHN
jgi:hypothetical protein